MLFRSLMQTLPVQHSPPAGHPLMIFFRSILKTQNKFSAGELKASMRRSEFMIERDWQEIRLYGDAAFVRFVQRIYDENIDRDETEQIRVLEKHEGKWLIAYAGALARYPTE